MRGVCSAIRPHALAISSLVQPRAYLKQAATHRLPCEHLNLNEHSSTYQVEVQAAPVSVPTKASHD